MTIAYKGHRIICLTMTLIYKCLLIFLVCAAFFINGQEIEKRFFPVVTDSEIIRSETVSATSVDAWFVFEKKRNCTFVDLDFYTIDPVNGRHHRVLYEFLSDKGLPPASRPVGKQFGGAWRIEISPEAFTGEILAIVHHRCHPFWVTESQFFP